MSRPLRIQYPGAIYHITARGNGGNNIFNNPKDYLLFLEELKKTIEEYNWICYAYCLMPNHYHLLIKTLDPNLSTGMRQLNGNYTQRYNIKHKRYGHLFQGRFKSVIVEDTGYLGNIVRYIVLNPVKAKLAKTISAWPWSSHKEVIGRKKSTGCVQIDETLKVFHKNKQTARKEYLKFIGQKCEQDETWQDLRSGFILGSLEFARDIVKQYGDNKARENIKKERFAGRPKLKEIFHEDDSKAKRNKNIMKAFKDYGYTQTQIGDHIDLHYSTVSRIIEKNRNSKNKT